MPHDEKICHACGRTIHWRKKWARDWPQIKWCSDRCRRQKVRTVDEELQTAITQLLQTKPHNLSICPSDAARSVNSRNWRSLIEPARAAARRLVKAGTHEITQKGRVVDPSTARGPIQVRRTTNNRQ